MLHTNIKRLRFISNTIFALFLVFAFILPIPARSQAAQDILPAAASLPWEANAPISALIGADQPSYHATTDRDGFQVDNAQGLSAHFKSSGVDFYVDKHSWGLSLTSYGYGEVLQQVVSSEPTARDNRIEYSRGYLTEWYVNGPFGLEQGFTLATPPAEMTDGPLTLALSMSGDLNAAVDKGGKGLSLSASEGTALLRYTGLLAYDAEGREFSTWLETQSDNQSNSTPLFIRVNDSGARYPLTIDPFIQKARLTASDKYYGDSLGSSVSISGDVVVVGLPYADPFGVNSAGKAYIFVNEGGDWADMTQTAKLKASDMAEHDNFGSSVSISGDVVVVGAPSADPGGTDDAGAAYVFVKPGSGWVGAFETAKLTASDKAANDWFGSSVSISGDVVVVGLPGADPFGVNSAGKAYVFVKPGSGWVDMTQTAKLKASDMEVDARFGDSVVISGDVVVVGAPSADPGGKTDAGEAYIFVKPGGGWLGAFETAKLTASDKAVSDHFGDSVSISGDVVVVGTPSADPGGTSNTGAAYVFVKPGGGWADMTQTARLTASDKAVEDHFGSSMAISGDVIVVGAPEKNGPYVDAGASYVFVKPDSGWADMTQTAKLTATDLDKYEYDSFGYSVSISGDVVVVGAPGADPVVGDYTIDNAGAAYVFVARYSTTTTITSDSPDPSLAGGTVNVSVTVSGGSTPSGTVDITGADTNCSINLSGGSGNCNVIFNTVGVKTLTATYNGDTNHARSLDREEHTVKAITTTTITSDAPDPSVNGQNVTVNFTVTVNSPGSGTPTGIVTVSDGVDSCSASAAAGSCTLALNTLGNRILTASYPGNMYFKGSSDTESHKVKAHTTTTIVHDNPDPSIINQAVTVNITVTSGTTAITGNVPITGADVNCVVTLSAGSGSCAVIFTKAGDKTLTATYSGDATYGGSSDSEAHAVKANTHTTIVADTPDPSAINQVVTVGVTVSGGPTTPTGTVSISGADVNCVITLYAGSGTCNANFTSGGAKILMATYNGNATHARSSDNEGHQVIPGPSQFYSAGTYDGYILESTETSSVGGSANASETTFRLGDGSADRQYRSILSFNTASLPDNAVITSIVLKIKKQGLVGIDPFTTHQGLKVDICKPYFGSEIGLAASDFQATADKSSVGTFGSTPSAGWYSVTLNSTAHPYINTTGTTQFRLRFQLDDDNDNVADYMKFFSGDYTTISSRPLLIIQYYLP
jgi:hypothetical protein